MKNKKNELQKVKFPIEKFPRLEAIEKQILTQTNLIDMLNLRKELLKGKIKKDENSEAVDRYESNERQILLIETDYKLAKVHSLILQKKTEVDNYIKTVIEPVINRIDAEYQPLLEKAEKRAKTDSTLKSVLDDTKFELFETNWEHKFNFFLAVKKYLKH